jgi:hypothetical protein
VPTSKIRGSGRSYGNKNCATGGTITYPRKGTRFGAQTKIASYDNDDQKTYSWTLPRQTCRGYLIRFLSKIQSLALKNSRDDEPPGAVAHHQVKIAAHHHTRIVRSRFIARSSLPARADNDGGPIVLRMKN